MRLEQAVEPAAAAVLDEGAALQKAWIDGAAVSVPHSEGDLHALGSMKSMPLVGRILATRLVVGVKVLSSESTARRGGSAHN